MADEIDGEESDLEREISAREVAFVPGDTGDPYSIVEAKIPRDIRDRYEIYSYRNAAVILSETRAAEFGELLAALRSFSITTTMIRTAGGNESDVPKLVSGILRPLGWHETIIQGDLLVQMLWKEPVVAPNGRIKFERRQRDIRRERFLDGHKIDYVKGKVAFDLEWNSKDQTFDRDLYAFSAFAQCGVIDAGVLLTRGASLTPVIRKLGQSLKKDGSPEYRGTGMPRMTHEKYGASTTWMGKLLYRLNAGRNGSCPVLAIGITPRCIEDWSDDDDPA